MIGVKVSDAFKAKKRRIESLPKISLDAIEATSRGSANRLVTIYHDGIKNDSFGLIPLKEATISRKEALGMESPDSPLYGYGDDDETKMTYANMLRVYNDDGKKKFLVKPAEGYHYMSDKDKAAKRKPIFLRDLFEIHEYGRTIANGFGKGIVVRIPPRPALHAAYVTLMAELKRDPRYKKVKDAILEYVRQGKTGLLQEIVRNDPESDKWNADAH